MFAALSWQAFQSISSASRISNSSGLRSIVIMFQCEILARLHKLLHYSNLDFSKFIISFAGVCVEKVSMMRGSAAMNWMCCMEVNIMAVRAEINYSRSGPLLNVFRLLHWKLMLPARQFEFAHLRANERSQTLKQTFGCFSFFGCCEVFMFSLFALFTMCCHC